MAVLSPCASHRLLCAPRYGLRTRECQCTQHVPNLDFHLSYYSPALRRPRRARQYDAGYYLPLMSIAPAHPACTPDSR